jgi:ribosomal protein S18 acetylase RimI-like enzyme
MHAMASITLPAPALQTGGLRSLNILRDLSAVADLIELCFEATLDDEGQSYLQQMRRASRDHDFLSWAGKLMDSASMPLSGFVWEENGKIVGNASLIYQFNRGRKIAMIANVATHPDYRRRGIGRALTERAMAGGRQRGAGEFWLHVRHDNPTAIKIYADLGFTERARRTTYHSTAWAGPQPPTSRLAAIGGEVSNATIVSRPESRYWPLQQEWLQRAHPAELNWYSRWDWKAFAPGWQNWLHRMLEGIDWRQWSAMRDGRLLATVYWMPTLRASNALWAAAPLDADPAGFRQALQTARRDLAYYRRLTVEYPAGQMVEAIEAAGFDPFRTLIWMRADATPGPARPIYSGKESTQ